MYKVIDTSHPIVHDLCLCSLNPVNAFIEVEPFYGQKANLLFLFFTLNFSIPNFNYPFNLSLCSLSVSLSSQDPQMEPGIMREDKSQ